MEIKRIPLKQINPAKYNPRKGLKPGDQPLIKKALSLDSDLVSQEVINALDKQPMTPLEHFQKALEGHNCPGIDKGSIIFKLDKGGDDPEYVDAE